MRRETGSSAFRWPKVKSIEGLQRRSCSRRRRKAGSGEEKEKRNETGTALLMALTASIVQRERASCSW